MQIENGSWPGRKDKVHGPQGPYRLTRGPIQGSLGSGQGQEASVLEMLGGQVAGDGGCPDALLPHQVTVLKES